MKKASCTLCNGYGVLVDWPGGRVPIDDMVCGSAMRLRQLPDRSELWSARGHTRSWVILQGPDPTMRELAECSCGRGWHR